MISRVTAEFESTEIARFAIKRVKESVDYVYSAKLIYHRIGEKTYIKRQIMDYTNIPLYYNSHSNCLTDVLRDPISNEIVASYHKSISTTACVICGSGAVDNVISVFNSMGGSNIRFAH